MSIMETIKTRRSVRKYTEEKLTEEQIGKLLEAAGYSATGRGKKPWHFITVDDREVLDRLSKARDGGKGGSKMLAGAPFCIVVTGDFEVSDTWVEDCSIAMTNMQLMAEEMGLGSCWIQIRMRQYDGEKTSEEYVREVLDIPEYYGVEAILSLGVPAEHPGPHTEPLDPKKIHRNRF